MRHVTAVPAVNRGSIVNLQNNMTAGEGRRLSKEGEYHGNNLKGGSFAAIGVAGRVHCLDDKRFGPYEMRAENDGARVVQTDGSCPTVTAPRGNCEHERTGLQQCRK